MMTLRRVAAVVIGAYVALWVPAIFVRLVDVPDWIAIALLVFSALLGASLGSLEASRLEPFSGREHRDAVIGWSIVLVPIGVIASFLLPLPWALTAAAGWVTSVLVVARTLLATAPVDGSLRQATSQSMSDRPAQ